MVTKMVFGPGPTAGYERRYSPVIFFYREIYPALKDTVCVVPEI
jgi:hypothetical protein